MSINPTEFPVIESIQKRWSPYRFDASPIDDSKILCCLEAARWAASSFNDQPWSWILAKRQDTEAFKKMVGCLLEANQGWAAKASVIMVSVIRTTFQYNGKPNRVALHDLGQASAHLALQATELGLQVHQMAGLNLSATRLAYNIPEGYQPETAIAIGNPDTSEPASEAEVELQKRELGPRKRRSLAEQVFEGTWSVKASFVPPS
ncbi:nitroreductase family protein [Rubripirellula reticaptiva]|uniref:Malonic semialdehyde reductase n=1 Tax=Rubripirellula reticaptiva TaxID=2528013 RepID=A0A5C6ETA5_9BACT|nr:nitroreductase family protein [Rubripirellula reticaptiva]TWU51925.1 malonic semialdehyde reductase [Rubripirellula reticaptiva]